MNDHNDLHELLLSSTKKVEETKGLGGMVAKLWRKILYDMNFQPGRMEHCLLLYVEKARRYSKDASVAGYYNKGNLRRALAKDTMTFKVFINALRVVGVTHVRFAVELTHKYGPKTRHEENFDISDNDLFEGETKKSMEEG